MTERGAVWRAFTVCILCSFSSAAISCGDDEDTTPEDSGTAGTGGKGGSGGKAGSGGKGGASGGPSTATCVTQSTAIFKDQPNGLSAECITCACTESAAAITACNNDAAMCWGLIQCVDEKCPDPATQAMCAPTMCRAFIPGAATAMAAGPVLSSTACKVKCAADTVDAGAPDAGN